jgi:hypothetical protein
MFDHLMKFLLFPLFTLVLIGGGCFNRTQQTAQPSDSGEINIADDTYTYEDKETGAYASIGENAQIPNDFPSDVPVYEGAQILAASVIPNQGATLLSTTTASLASVAQWYEDELLGDGWEMETDSNYNGRLMKVFQKGDVIISVAVSEMDGQTSITVIRAIK